MPGRPVEGEGRAAPGVAVGAGGADQRGLGPASAPTTPRRSRFGPFLTFVEDERPDGLVARWGSRDYRKHVVPTPEPGSTWWAPRARGWWIGVLFAVGSVLFAVGVIPAYSRWVGPHLDPATFFVG